MLAVLVTGPTATQNSSFFLQQLPKPLPVLIAPTNGRMARLSGPEWPGKYRIADWPGVVTNPGLTGLDVA